MALIKFLALPTLAGLFFCLASTWCRAFILSRCNTATYKRLQRPFCRQCNYAAKTPKPLTGIYSGVSVDSPHSSAHNTADVQATYTPPAQRWMAYRQVLHLHQYQIPPPCRTLYRGNVSTYYNNVYKGAAVRPCRGSMPGSAT